MSLSSQYFYSSIASAVVAIVSGFGIGISKIMKLVNRISKLEIKVDQIVISAEADRRDLESVERRLTEQLIRIESKLDSFLLKDK